MSKDSRHADFEINFIENNQIRITTDDCSIVTEYFEDNDVKRTTMGPANILFSAFALWASMDILAFCRKRSIATDGFRIRQIVDWNRKLTDQSKILLNIGLPDQFPEKYEKSIGKIVDSCLVARLGRGLNENSFEKLITRSESTWSASKDIGSK